MIPVSRPCITEEDIERVTKSLTLGYISGDAPPVVEFENFFAEELNRKHAVAVTNGSVALDLALHALDLDRDDEVVIPSFTIASCLFAVLKTKARPVFADVEESTWNISIETLLPAITQNTKAVIVVHTYGLAVDLDPILEYCANHNIAVIEDAAEAHGLRYKGRLCGSFGLISTFSFYANKMITSGEGGIVLTDDDSLARRIRGLRNLAFLPPPGPRFVHNELGWNARLSALQATLAHSQSLRINSTVAEKRKIGLTYHDQLSHLNQLVLQPTSSMHCENSYWVFGLVLNEHLSRKDVISGLIASGVDCRPFFHPLHLQPLLAKFSISQSPSLRVSELIGRQGLYLPSFLGITTDELAYCAQTLIGLVT